MTASYERGERDCNSAGSDDAEFGDALSILVVDDVEAVALLLQEALTHYGHTADYALSGEEALRIFVEREFDAVVSDLEMPEMNGLELRKQLREVCTDQGIRQPAFILLTGWGEDTDLEESTSLHGVDAIVTKPVDVKWLLEVVRNAVVANSSADEEK